MHSRSNSHCLNNVYNIRILSVSNFWHYWFYHNTEPKKTDVA